MATLLNGNWVLREAGKSETTSCPIPGDNYSALQDAGLIPDPYWRDNETKVQWVADRDWIFSRKFTVGPELLKRRAVVLSFDSIDTVAEILVNGKSAGRACNQFRRWRYEVKRLLRDGANEIEVRIASPRRAAREAVAAANSPVAPACANDGSVLGLNFLRKCQCSAGWDWGISLPASGIYGDVALIGADAAILDSAWCDTKFRRDGSCRVDVNVRMEPVRGARAGEEVSAEVSFDGESRTVAGRIPAAPGPFVMRASFVVERPRLWWPAGYGGQPLYRLSVASGDCRIERGIGLRRLEVVTARDRDGARFAFRVNGVEVFAKGADWIPCDARPRHEDDARIRDLLRSAVAANMNMLRIWGGGHFEGDFFYDECDRLGILLWHDMMLACMRYPCHRDFIGNMRAEAEYQVRRLRDHASIALWCGDNECLSAVDWGRKTQAQREAETVQWATLNNALAEAVGDADPSRLFWPSSPCTAPGDFRHNNVNNGSGDTHYWAVWHGGRRFDGYYEHQPRFCSEFGFQSFPSLETTRTYASEKDGDFNLFSPVMDVHQKHHSGNSIIFSMFANYYRLPRGFAESLYLSQVQQAEAMRTAVEYWRTLMPFCMGTIIWQLNDNWPVASWSSLEYGGRWKALHSAARRFYAPLAAFAFRKRWQDPVEAHVVWDLPEAVDATVSFSLRRIADGSEIRGWTEKVAFAGQGTRSLALPKEVAAPLPDRNNRGVNAAPPPAGEPAPEECFLVVRTSGRTASGRTYRHEATIALDAWKRCELPVSGLAVKAVRPAGDEAGAFDVEVAAKAPSFFAWLTVEGDPLGRFSDNLMTVLPGEPRTIRFRPGAKTTAAELKRRLGVADLRSSY